MRGIHISAPLQVSAAGREEIAHLLRGAIYHQTFEPPPRESCDDGTAAKTNQEAAPVPPRLVEIYSGGQFAGDEVASWHLLVPPTMDLEREATRYRIYRDAERPDHASFVEWLKALGATDAPMEYFEEP